MYEFLQDKLFLNQLDNLRVKEQFVRITVGTPEQMEALKKAFEEIIK